MTTPLERLSLVRSADLLVLDVAFVNLALSDDGMRLERGDPNAAACIVVHLPSQHVGEEAFLETQAGGIVPPPPVGALAAGPTRLAFDLPEGVQSLSLSLEGLLDWAALVPRLAGNALPPGAVDGPAPAVPDLDRTAIEFPYRLLLSPDASGRWEHVTEVPAAAERTEIWHTRLIGTGTTTPLRAVGRRPVQDALRTALADRDLDEIVMLSANFALRPKSWAELRIPQGRWIQMMRAAGLWEYRYVPVPLQAERLTLSALGASARLSGRWSFPEPHQDTTWWPTLGMPIPSLSEYQHIAGYGRDQYVRVVRRGFVHTGMRATLVKVTERRFQPKQIATEPSPDGPIGIFGSTGYLRQYFRIIVQEPELDYATLAGGYAHGGREMPLRRIRLTTEETPKIDLPGVAPEAIEAEQRAKWVRDNHREPSEPADFVAIATMAQQALEQRLAGVFWVQVAGTDFRFGFVATDWEGREVAGELPLLFVPEPFVATIDGGFAAVSGEYVAGAMQRRTIELRAQTLAIADPTGSVPGSTALPTRSVTLRLHRRGAGAVPPTYRPGWVLAMAGAEATLEAVARVTGRQTSVPIELHDAYLKEGLAAQRNAAGLFAKFDEQRIVFGGAGGGGVARPDSGVEVLSSRQGAMARRFAEAAVSPIDMAKIFGDAWFLGTIKLADLLADLPTITPEHYGSADLAEDELQRRLDDALARIEIPILRTRELPDATEARFLWKPRIKDIGPFRTGDRSRLVLEARTLTPLRGGRAAESTVRGEIREFTLSFFGVVRVEIALLRFLMQPGRKPDVTVEGLDLVFEGPLNFVNSLRRIIPSDGFSDPPAVQVTTEGIRAGYSIGVPTVGVGVFSLQNLSLSAALSVPFIGKPAGLRFAISERHHPFLVTVTLFGGGGFFALGVGATGVEEIEASIEFGGNIALNLGVASGGVYVMAGVYYGRTGQTTVLTGYLRCGGYLSVLGIISISIEFYLAFTYRDKGGGGSEVWGQASVTVSVKVVCFSVSVSLSIERRFAGAGGDPTLEDVMDGADWQDYCLAFAAEGAP